MKFALIATVYNEGPHIRDFVESLNAQTDMVDEVVLLDGGSSDLTVSLIKKVISERINFSLIVDDTCNRRYFVGPIARGRNIAISYTSADVILVTDAGCILDPNWISNMKKCFLSGSEVVSGGYSALPGNRFQAYISDVFCPHISPVRVKDYIPSSRSLGFKRELWEKVGGYPENSYTAEDTLFALRLFEQTDKVSFAKNAVVYWQLPESFRSLMKKVYNYGVGEGVQKLYLNKYIFRALMVIFPIPLLVLIAFRKKRLISYPMYVAQTAGYLVGMRSRGKL